ncbi:hypothetical protein RUND412_004886 [Rhizina undulata]
MCCNGDLLTRGLLLVNASSILLSTRPFPSSRLARLVAVTLVCACALQLVDIWGLTLGFWWNLSFIVAGICLHSIIPFVIGVWRERRDFEDQFKGKFRPLFFFCSTTHSRFLPKKHTFKYPVLYVGFPVNFRGSIGGLFSVLDSRQEKEEQLKLGQRKENGFTFFSINPAGYTNPDLPFDKKLDSVLSHHGYEPSDYPYTYLVTTPRFLGYSFNPVSYYYLYSAQQELKLVVLEVNNTFGEKHLYLLHADSPANPPARKGYTFAGEMEKAFHISPFNHRSGNYNIQVRDPLDQYGAEASKVDMHMLVMARDGTKTMVARAFSISPSFDMVRGGVWRGLAIAATWGYNTFLAVPETMFEAWRLYRKKTVVYTRPEPLAGSGQRDATKAEMDMQRLWLDFFQHRVSNYHLPLSVKFTLPESNATKVAETVMFQSNIAGKVCPTECRGSAIHLPPTASIPPARAATNSAQLSQPQPLFLNIRVTNPRFFARFFSHQDARQTVYLDIISQPVERRLAEIDDLRVFLDILSPHSSSSGKSSNTSENQTTSLLQPSPSRKTSRSGLRWRIVSWLRRWKTMGELKALPPVVLPEDSLLPPALLPAGSFNTLDEYHLSLPDSDESAARLRRTYRQKTLQAVLIDYIAFGESESLELYGKIVNLLLHVLLMCVTVTFGSRFPPAEGLKGMKCFLQTLRSLCVEQLDLGWFTMAFAAVNGPWIWRGLISSA